MDCEGMTSDRFFPFCTREALPSPSTLIFNLSRTCTSMSRPTRLPLNVTQANFDELEAGSYKLKPQPLPYFLSAEQTDGSAPPYSVIETSSDLWFFVELPGVEEPKLSFRPMIQGMCCLVDGDDKVWRGVFAVRRSRGLQYRCVK